MYVIAHIGNIPVEEWAPFLVPALTLYFYGRRKGRRRRDAVQRLPDASELLDERTIALVVDRWSKANHQDLSPAHLPLLCPPGPDGLTAHELAQRTIVIATLAPNIRQAAARWRAALVAEPW